MNAHLYLSFASTHSPSNGCSSLAALRSCVYVYATAGAAASSVRRRRLSFSHCFQSEIYRLYTQNATRRLKIDKTKKKSEINEMVSKFCDKKDLWCADEKRINGRELNWIRWQSKTQRDFRQQKKSEIELNSMWVSACVRLSMWFSFLKIHFLNRFARMKKKSISSIVWTLGDWFLCASETRWKCKPK